MPDDFSGKMGLDALFENPNMDSFCEMMDKVDKDAPIPHSLDPAIYAECFGSDAGRMVLQDMYNRYVNVTIVEPGMAPETHGIRQGQANVVFHIVNQFDLAFKGE